ncbi:M67 family metallopeptidase, partial [Salibacterium salarium]
MINHCKQELPFEACGLVSGNAGKCDDMWRMKNRKKSRHSFEISQKEIDETFRAIEAKGQTLTGIYHSHPTAAPYPSPHDITNNHYPHAAYFIISFLRSKPQVKCWRMENKNTIPVKIKV